MGNKPKRVKDRLSEIGVRPVKERGQNFLIDSAVLDQILEFGSPLPREQLVEIGPGLGALTERLAAIAPLAVIEIEESFCADLRGRFPHISVHQGDAREFDLSRLGERITVFGNLPYAFSTEIVFHLLESRSGITRAVLLLQREFAERMAAGSGSRSYGRLSIACSLHSDLRLGPVIAGDSFHPPTSVESRLIEMRFLARPRYDVGDSAHFERVVKAAFAERRKKIINSFKAAGFFPMDSVVAGLAEAGIDPGLRAEAVDLERFAALSRALFTRIG